MLEGKIVDGSNPKPIGRNVYFNDRMIVRAFYLRNNKGQVFNIGGYKFGGK